MSTPRSQRPRLVAFRAATPFPAPRASRSRPACPRRARRPRTARRGRCARRCAAFGRRRAPTSPPARRSRGGRGQPRGRHQRDRLRLAVLGHVDDDAVQAPADEDAVRRDVDAGAAFSLRVLPSREASRSVRGQRTLLRWRTFQPAATARTVCRGASVLAAWLVSRPAASIGGGRHEAGTDHPSGLARFSSCAGR
jgi:hypothetical protein